MQTSVRGKVALFATNFVPYSQTFVYDEIRAHTRYELDVFCKTRQNADVFPYDRVFKPETALGQRLYENLGYWPAFDRKLAAGNYDLVHAHFGTGAVYALPYIRKNKLPFVVTFHGNDVGALIGSQRLHPKRWRYLLKAPKVMRSADLMLAASQELCDIVAELSGRPDAVKLYQVGIDVDRFRPIVKTTTIPRIAMVGRFTEKKGHMYALEAFKKVIDHGREARLVLVGEGELLSQCINFVDRNGMSEHVEFAGVLSPDDTAAVLAGSDIALTPSVVAANNDREGGPLVIKEAGACEVPVIGTYHSGIPETIDDGITGFLVPERDSETLAQRMLDLIDDADLRKRLGKAARKRIEQDFELFKQVEKLESHYDSIR